MFMKVQVPSIWKKKKIVMIGIWIQTHDKKYKYTTLTTRPLRICWRTEIIIEVHITSTPIQKKPNLFRNSAEHQTVKAVLNHNQ